MPQNNTKLLNMKYFWKNLFPFWIRVHNTGSKLCKSYKESMKLTAKSTKLKVMSNPYHRSKICFT
jgi:hypothetical protein